MAVQKLRFLNHTHADIRRAFPKCEQTADRIWFYIEKRNAFCEEWRVKFLSSLDSNRRFTEKTESLITEYLKRLPIFEDDIVFAERAHEEL